MPLLPASPQHRKVLAGAFLALSLAALAYQASRFLHAGHDHDAPPVLLYDLDRKVLAHYPPGTHPGDVHAAALVVFAKTRAYEKPAPGMTLDDLEKAGLQLGWLHMLAEDRRTGLYADPRHPDQWVRSDSPECQTQLNLWMNKAAAFSSTGTPIPCRD